MLLYDIVNAYYVAYIKSLNDLQKTLSTNCEYVTRTAELNNTVIDIKCKTWIFRVMVFFI